jgi:hypothetical protein
MITLLRVEKSNVPAWIHPERPQGLSLIGPPKKVVAPSYLVSARKIERQDKVRDCHAIDFIGLGLNCVTHLIPMKDRPAWFSRVRTLSEQIHFRIT